MTELRIGDAEREHVGDILQRHAAEGRLTLDELSDRLGEVYAARTASDLDRALRELPPLPPRRAQERRRLGTGLAPPVAFAAAALLFGLWAVVAITTGTWFFWPLLALLFFRLLGGPRRAGLVSPGPCGGSRGR